MRELVGWWFSLSSEAQAAWAQAILSIIGIAIAIFVPWRSNRAALKAQKQSLQPHLAFHTRINPEKREIAIDLASNGLGPAIVKSFRAELDGREVNLALPRALVNVGSMLELDFGRTGATTVTSGTWMAAGEKFRIFELTNASDDAFKRYCFPGNREIEAQFSRLVFTVEYKSVFGDIIKSATNRGLAQSAAVQPQQSALDEQSRATDEHNDIPSTPQESTARRRSSPGGE